LKSCSEIEGPEKAEVASDGNGRQRMHECASHTFYKMNIDEKVINYQKNTFRPEKKVIHDRYQYEDQEKFLG